MSGFPHFFQTDSMTCGPTCLRMIASFYGKNIALDEVVKLCRTDRTGSSLLGISGAAETIGFRTEGVKVGYEQLAEEVTLPCIAHWDQNHFVVIYRITRKSIFVSDPTQGHISYSKSEFLENWAEKESDKGILLILAPTNEFHSGNGVPSNDSKGSRFSFVFKYIKIHRTGLLQLILGLLAGSFFQLLFPLLTQSIVDVGIANHDYTFINLMLISQLMLFISRNLIEVMRTFILLNISSRINMSLVSDFFYKLMSLPISYFDSKMTGDIMQRINDNRRIESFLTGSSLSTLFSIFNFLVFSGVLICYSTDIFAVFLVGSALYFLWIVLFLKRRAKLDTMRFKQSSKNQTKIMELINGMQEIKLQNAERQKRWQLETLQVKLFKINLKGLKLTTMQNSGSFFIDGLKTIVITYISANLVIQGKISLGMMLSISYIVGQLSAPVMGMVRFIQNLQDARLSLDRLGEVHKRPSEEDKDSVCTNLTDDVLPISIQHVSFRYDSGSEESVIKDISIEIPAKKTTAIVGSSGSGKTTLMKLLLKFYLPSNGVIKVGEIDLNNVDIRSWRDKTGVVMQEGFIFNDTIANNIAVGSSVIDDVRLKDSLKIANITEFIESLPLHLNTKIGADGLGLSSGQKQRILIARAVYKNPCYLFFDEATSSLDANNERIISDNLARFCKNKTVVIIAHRLSTVMNADQIFVVEKGEVIEVGSHEQLIFNKGHYFELIKNQLELNV